MDSEDSSDEDFGADGSEEVAASLKNLRRVTLRGSWQKWLKRQGKKLKQEVSEKDYKTYRKMFDLLDVDNGGTLDVDEISTALEALGLKADREEIKRQMNALSYSNEEVEEIDFETFIEFLHDHVDAAQTENSKKKGVRLPFFLWIPAFQRRKNIEVVMSMRHMDNLENHLSLPKQEEIAEVPAVQESQSSDEAFPARPPPKRCSPSKIKSPVRRRPLRLVDVEKELARKAERESARRKSIESIKKFKRTQSMRRESRLLEKQALEHILNREGRKSATLRRGSSFSRRDVSADAASLRRTSSMRRGSHFISTALAAESSALRRTASISLGDSV